MSEPRLQEEFTADSVRIQSRLSLEPERLRVELQIDSEQDCVLHWGLSKRRDLEWQRPQTSSWPIGSRATPGPAVQTPCSAGSSRVLIELPRPVIFGSLPFVVYLPRENRWLKHRGEDFRIRLPRDDGAADPMQALTGKTTEPGWRRHAFELDRGEVLAAGVLEDEDSVRVLLASDAEPPLLLHWGLAGRFRHQWQRPGPELLPAGSQEVDAKAARSPFSPDQGLQWLELDFPRDPQGKVPRGLNFLLFQPAEARWLKAGGGDLYLRLSEAEETGAALPSETLRALAERIVQAEMTYGSWTLMHRFDLCRDLLEQVQDDPDGLALLYAWLRFSAIRQLDWQRNYNTKPRELSHAQERLTNRLADGYVRNPESRFWMRLMLGTLGRGGDGQKVRDEILNIMHRHHIKEMHGHFMEEWHQKLHNNTTPDDIVICEAYLAFLNSGGDLGRFYDTLAAGGVTPERLRSFERPITTDPEFYRDKRNGLAHDFEHFLRILKSVHSGTDLDTAAGAARGFLSPELNDALNRLYALQHAQAPVYDRAASITDLRERLAECIRDEGEPEAVRELLYLDLALEQVLRNGIEQHPSSEPAQDELAGLTALLLRNLALGPDGAEFALCAKDLQALGSMTARNREWALHAKSVTDRAARATARWSEGVYARLQPLAEYLGEAFEADSWTIPLFSEEVIRGGAGFMLSLLLRRLDPLLRESAGLGGWQIVSPGHGIGRVQVVESLRQAQGSRFPRATVLVTDRVAGDEEIPEGVTSVITSDTPDLVSHVAVRARNGRVLLASCYDEARYRALKALAGHDLALDVSPGGDVEIREAEAAAVGEQPKTAGLHLRRRSFSSWALGSASFDPEVVGGKSDNLQALTGRLPDWIRRPASVALPFGVFERTLEHPDNRETALALRGLLARVGEDPQHRLPEVRALVEQLSAPPELRPALDEVWRAEGLPPVAWPESWKAIRRVWASKWNERAWYSREAKGIDHDDLMMAVLIQEVVRADHAFVIHTVNPINGRDDELFAEVVPGLGETLVGNYPGRALGFTCRKQDLELRILSYPSKSLGLFGGGVIFRSDSNGEDLEHFAGAGLYDSFLAEPPEERLLDYGIDPLIRDPEARAATLLGIARVGLAVEQACGSPQDVEGAVQDGQYFLVQTRAQVGL